MKKYRTPIGVALTIALLTLGAVLLLRGVHFDVLQPAGDIAKQQRSLMIFALLLMGVVAIPVFVMLGLFAWKYREGNTKRKKNTYKPEWGSSKRLEILWWGIPIVLIVVLAVTAWVTSHSLDPYKKIESKKDALEVQVVALQWKWLFIYPQLGVSTVNKLPVPVDTPINFTISADAPMSAFWVPALGSQIYAMNGMSTKLSLIADTTGQFPGYSTNINGKGYSDMKFTVYSQSDADFAAWVKTAQQSPNLMDTAQYERLATPGLADEASYVLTENHLYDTIVGKYMSGMSHGSSTGTHKMEDGTTMKNGDMDMDHDSSMHSMEGM